MEQPEPQPSDPAHDPWWTQANGLVGVPRAADPAGLPDLARLPGPSSVAPQLPGPSPMAPPPPASAVARPELVFVLCFGRSGSTLLRFLLDAHPDLACPPETRLPTMCAQMAGVWSQLEGAPLSAERTSGLPVLPEAALAGIRATMDLMVGSYLARRGKSRYCDKSLGAAEHADLLMRVFPEAKFVCLYRPPMDVIASGIEASPWGLNGFGFDAYAASSPGNAVLALAQFWADNTAAILAVEQRFLDRCHRVRYEDLVAAPEKVAAGIFLFLGVPAAPGISERCFTADRERLGPADYKIWHTSRISADSVGRGWSIPASLIGPTVTATVNDLAAKLEYTQVGKQWGIAPVVPDLRQRGSGSVVPSAQPLAGGGGTWPGYRPMTDRLRAGLARYDRFARQWEPCSRETFLVTVTLPAADGVAARWRVDLAAQTVASAGDTAGAHWDLVGSTDTWDQLISGAINLSVAFRRRQLRYCDTGDAGATLPGLRMGMIADLLGITAWQPVATSPADSVSPADPGGPADSVSPADSAGPPGSVPRAQTLRG